MALEAVASVMAQTATTFYDLMSSYTGWPNEK